jgi:hypothetical protein
MMETNKEETQNEATCVIYKITKVQYILSRILLMRQVVNGFSGLMNWFIGQLPGWSTNTYNTSEGYWNNNTQSLQHFHC